MAKTKREQVLMERLEFAALERVAAPARSAMKMSMAGPAKDEDALSKWPDRDKFEVPHLSQHCSFLAVALRRGCAPSR
jgi:hypothetical protein